MSDNGPAYLSKLLTINIGRRGFIRVATGAAVGMTSGPFLIRRAHGQSKQPLVILYGVPRATMDAQNHINTYDESPLGNMFENLVDMSNPIDPYKGWKPMLAVSWKRLNETTFQFRLRENVKFHNGEPFDAEAVKFSVDRLLGRVDKSFLPPTVAWHAYDTVNKAEPVDRHTVNVITKVPDPIVLNRFNGFGMRIVSPKFYSEHPTAYLQNNANGTGPYRLVSWVKDGDLVMEANQQYWGGAPAFEKVIVRTVPEASTRVSALMSGQADVVVAVPAEQGDMVSRSGRARVEHVTSNRFGWWRMNAHVTPTDNIKVRQAINFGANVGELLRTVYSGLGEQISTVIGKYHFGYDPAIPFYPHDPERARKLLKESGLPLPVTVNFHFIQGRYTKDKDMGEGIIGELNKVGQDHLRVIPRLYEAGSYYSQANAGKLDGIIFNSWGNWMFDADIDLGPLWRTKTTPTPDYPNDPALDKLIDEARGTLDEQRRKALYSQVQKMMWENPFSIPGMQVVDMYGVSSRVAWKPRPDEMIWAKEMKPRTA
jgi:peptide/nickel transport system substrate-binding protein